MLMLYIQSKQDNSPHPQNSDLLPAPAKLYEFDGPFDSPPYIWSTGHHEGCFASPVPAIDVRSVLNKVPDNLEMPKVLAECHALQCCIRPIQEYSPKA